MTESKEKSEHGNRREVADRLHSAAIHLLRRVRKQDTIMAQVPARLSALSVLVFGGPMTLGQLAAAEQVKPPTMTRIVTGLEKSRLAERTPHLKDARRVTIQATPKGMRLMQKGREARIEYMAGQLASLSREELGTLARATDILDRVFREWSSS